MSDGMFRAEIVFIGDSDEGDSGAAQTQRVPDELSGKGETPSRVSQSTLQCHTFDRRSWQLPYGKEGNGFCTFKLQRVLAER